MKQAQKGFTLIELVVVMTIIAILAAVALPRFVALQRDARIAKLNAARGAVGASAALVHGGYLSRGGIADTINCSDGVAATNTINGTLCTENGRIQLANGYPSGAVALAAAVPGIVGAAGLTTVFSPTLIQLQDEGFDAAVAGSVTTIQIYGAPAPGNCQFTYASAAANAAPTISIATTTGC